MELRNVSRWSTCSWRIWIAKHSVFSAISRNLLRLMPTSTMLRTPRQASQILRLRSIAAHVRIAKIAQRNLPKKRTRRWRRWVSFVNTVARFRRLSRTRCLAQISYHSTNSLIKAQWTRHLKWVHLKSSCWALKNLRYYRKMLQTSVSLWLCSKRRTETSLEVP